MGAPRGREPPFHHPIFLFRDSSDWDEELKDLASLEFLFDMFQLILVSMVSYGCILASWLMYNDGAQKRRLSAITLQPGPHLPNTQIKVNKTSAPAVLHSRSHWKVNIKWVYN